MIIDPASAPVSGQNGLSTLHLSVAGGLSQFGAYVDTLAPGAWSSHRPQTKGPARSMLHPAEVCCQ